MKQKNTIIPQIMTIMLVVFMILLSEMFQEKEFIFPEITALTIGAWLAPKQVWKTSKMKLVVLIGIYATLGLVLVKYIDIAMYFKILIGFVLCLFGLYVSKTTFAPLISATILPIIIHSESWIYPLFAVCMSIVIVLGQMMLEKLGYREKHHYEPVDTNKKETMILNSKRFLIISIFAWVALSLKLPFMIAPPLMVAFVELSSNHPKLRHNAFKLGVITFLCAFSGAYIRILICDIAHLPLTVAAFLIVIMMLMILHHYNLYFPPAGALAILPLLIAPSNLMIYPFVVLCGYSIFVLSAFIITKTPLSSIDCHW